MDGGEVGGCRCAVGEGARYAGVVDAAGDGEGCEGGFEREGVGVEPGEEGRFAEEAGVGVLGGVDVRVFDRMMVSRGGYHWYITSDVHSIDTK